MEGATERLPFSVVDEAVHLLDNDVEPWSIQFEVRVRGHLDEERLRAALERALSLHPMARARRAAVPLTERHHRWEIPDRVDLDPLRVEECRDDAMLAAARDRLQSVSVPLVESPPLRVLLARHPCGDVVMLNANHAATDGFGCLRLMRSLALAYVGAPDPQPRMALDSVRDVELHLAAGDTVTLARRLGLLLEKGRDLVTRPARIAPEEGASRPGYGFHHRRLSAEETAALAHLDHPATVNDLLVAALHLAVDRWNAGHGTRSRRISVLMPVNLRPLAWREEVVGNYALMVRLASTRAQRSTPATLLETIREQTGSVKRHRTGAALIELLCRISALPLWAKRAMSSLIWLTGNRLVDTAELTSIGRVEPLPCFGDGAGEVSELWFSAPARMPLGLSLGAATAGGRLHLSFRHRHPLWSAAAAGRFADVYLASLRACAAAAGAAADTAVEEAAT